MSIALTYHNDLSRVQISLSGLSENAVRIERSANELFWEPIRGGLSVPVISGSASLNDFEFQADVENFYRVLDAGDPGGVPVESDSITPSLSGSVWLKSIRFPSLNRIITLLDRGQPETRESRAEVFHISGRSVPVGSHELATGKKFTHHIKTEGSNHLADARDLDLILTIGGVFFIHVPAGVRAPGGFVVFTSHEQSRMFHGSDTAPHVFDVECQIVAPPGPDIVGTTLTWGTVFNTYGSWTALVNANPTWTDLLESVGSVEDLVVL